jgi:outer membrane receptor for ferrienterochelin and colicins
LNGESFARSAQAEFNWDVHRRVDLRIAYRWVDAQTDRLPGNPTQDPFVSKHRSFVQWSYASALSEGESQWLADATFQWVGAQRLPSTASNPELFQRRDEAPGFAQLNLQATRQFSPSFSFYAGVENALNYRQDRPIIGADYGNSPASASDFNQYFDASLVYAPIFGRMIYAGLRWNILPSAAS